MTTYPPKLEYIRERWFSPILEDIERFEDQCDVPDEFKVALSDAAPDWVSRGVWEVAKDDESIRQIKGREPFNSRTVGILVGIKSALCDGMERAHRLYPMFSAKQKAELEKRLGTQVLSEATMEWKLFAEVLAPSWKQIKCRCLALVVEQNTFEQIKFYQGLTQGLEYLKRLIERSKKRVSPSAKKRESDTAKRLLVYTFAAANVGWIESNKKNLSWPELTEAFDKWVNYEVEVDDETFHQILHRAGLRVGKTGPRAVKT